MDNYNTESYGERIAGVYDEWYPQIEPGMIEVLKELAGGGPALELGIGTGRIALPLLEAGIPVHGIDASPAMVEKLRGKPRGSEVPVTLGNFADVDVTGHYKLIYVLFNTFFALLTQDEQIRCLKNAASIWPRAVIC